MIAKLRARRRWRKRLADRSPWAESELARMTAECQALRKRSRRTREKARQLLRRLPW